MKILNIVLTLGTTLALSAGSATAVTSFTETFDSNASNWLDGEFEAPTYHSTGGIANSGYISYTAPDFNSGEGSFGSALKIMFRGNASNDASGDAFVGDWLSADITTFSVAVRHNYSTSLTLYTRIAASAPPGAGASLASFYSIEPNTWTTITIPVTDSNPPFTSYGSSSFNGIFSNVQNLQIGLYLPENTDISGLNMDLDNVSIVPEPHEYALGMAGLLAIVVLARRRRLSAQA